MTADLTLFVNNISDIGWLGLLIFLRVAAAMALLPAMGERNISVRVRLLAALALTVVIAPLVTLDAPEPSLSAFVRFLATETLAGLALGAMLRLFVLALQTAGAIAAQSTSLSQLLGGSATEPLPAIGHIVTVAGLALLMMTGFHIKAAEFLAGSYTILPAGTFPSASDLTTWGVAGVGRSFSLAFQLAVPFVILSVLYNLAIGAINRAMPQLMVAFVGAPVITFGSIALLMLTAPTMLQVWAGALDSFLQAPLGGTP